MSPFTSTPSIAVASTPSTTATANGIQYGGDGKETFLSITSKPEYALHSFEVCFLASFPSFHSGKPLYVYYHNHSHFPLFSFRNYDAHSFKLEEKSRRMRFWEEEQHRHRSWGPQRYRYRWQRHQRHLLPLLHLGFRSLLDDSLSSSLPSEKVICFVSPVIVGISTCITTTRETTSLIQTHFFGSTEPSHSYLSKPGNLGFTCQY